MADTVSFTDFSVLVIVARAAGAVPEDTIRRMVREMGVAGTLDSVLARQALRVLLGGDVQDQTAELLTLVADARMRAGVPHAHP